MPKTPALAAAPPDSPARLSLTLCAGWMGAEVQTSGDEMKKEEPP